MTLTIPYTFATASGSIPLSQLDANFSATATAVNGLLPASSADVTFLQSGTGAVTRTVQSKERETKSLLDYGTAANWSNAATTAIASVSTGSTIQTNVPYGSYSLPTVAITGGNLPVWIVASDASVDAMKLGASSGGAVVRPRRTLAWTFGTYDNAAAASVISNPTYDQPAQVSGFNTPSAVSAYSDRDSVAFYSSNLAPAAAATFASATYTATTIVPNVAVDVSLLRVGMLIDTLHVVKFTGTITGWANDGSFITTSGWFAQGNASAGQVPSGGTGAVLNPITKAWAQNTNVFLETTSYANAITAAEIGVFNNKAEPVVSNEDNPALSNPYAWGVDVVSLGTYSPTHAFLARGNFRYGYMSRGQTVAGFVCAQGGSVNPTYGFLSRIASGIPFAALDATDGLTFFQVGNSSPNQSFTFGKGTATTSVFLNFRTGTAAVADSLIVAFGGNGSSPVIDLRSNVVRITSRENEVVLWCAAAPNAVNYMQLTSAATGAAPILSSAGTDANIDILLSPKGAGNVRFGNLTANADVPITGYITIKDASGTTRKLAVIA
jgi:hypothetical protein